MTQEAAKYIENIGVYEYATFGEKFVPNSIIHRIDTPSPVVNHSNVTTRKLTPERNDGSESGSNDGVMVVMERDSDHVKEHIFQLLSEQKRTDERKRNDDLNAQKQRYENEIKRMKIEFNEAIVDIKRKQWCRHCQKEANGQIVPNFCSIRCMVDW